MRTKKQPVETIMYSEYLTVAEVKDYLKISQSAAYGLAHSKDFPCCRIGASIRIPKEAFMAWLQTRTVISSAVAEHLRSVS